MKTKIRDFFAKMHATIKPYEKNLIFPILKILAVIIVCVILVRFLGGNETLSDYAHKNPDIAYGVSIENEPK